jgi:hypothetical protein
MSAKDKDLLLFLMTEKDELCKHDQCQSDKTADQHTGKSDEEIGEPENLQVKKQEMVEKDQDRGICEEPAETKDIDIWLTAGLDFPVGTQHPDNTGTAESHECCSCGM